MSNGKSLSEKQVYNTFTIFLVLISLGIRIYGFGFISADYNLFLKPWYDEIKSLGGLRALGQQVGDYNITYQAAIAVFTYIKVNPLYCYKVFSVVFDYVLALGNVLLISCLRPDLTSFKSRLTGVASILFLPSVILNSAYWGQCDVIYVSFIVLALYFLFREKYTLAFVFLGFSFAFKLQVVFILPFVVCWCWYKKKAELFKLLIIPAVAFVMTIPAVIMGRKWYEFITIYMSQTDTYQAMSYNAPNIWQVIEVSYEKMKLPAIIICMSLLGICLLLTVLKKIPLEHPAVYAGVAVWCAWTCVMFLPAMHERYFYIVDVLILILAIAAPRRYLIWCIAEEIISMLATYLRCMFFAPVDLNIVTWINIALYAGFTVVLVLDVIKKNKTGITRNKAA